MVGGTASPLLIKRVVEAFAALRRKCGDATEIGPSCFTLESEVSRAIDLLLSAADGTERQINGISLLAHLLALPAAASDWSTQLCSLTVAAALH